MKTPTLLEQVTEAFCCLPGIGPKSAQRMLLHLLERDPSGGRQIAALLNEALERIRHCERCRNLTEQPLCSICEDTRRDDSLLCVVESPADVFAIEQAGAYRGRYFVLMGTLSPIDGRGPDEIGMAELAQRCAGEVKEVILALSSTVEGEATAHYVAETLDSHGVAVSRIAQGIPVGGELEFVDGGTLSQALAGRRPV